MAYTFIGEPTTEHAKAVYTGMLYKHNNCHLKTKVSLGAILTTGLESDVSGTKCGWNYRAKYVESLGSAEYYFPDNNIDQMCAELDVMGPNFGWETGMGIIFA